MRACLGGQAALEIFTVVIAYEVDELLVRVDVEFCIGVFAWVRTVFCETKSVSAM